jgi:hypothetical protein
MPDTTLINYVPRRAALPDQPRKVSVSSTRTAEGLRHPLMPIAEPIARGFERQRQLWDIAMTGDTDNAECAAADLAREFPTSR